MFEKSVTPPPLPLPPARRTTSPHSPPSNFAVDEEGAALPVLNVGCFNESDNYWKETAQRHGFRVRSFSAPDRQDDVYLSVYERVHLTSEQLLLADPHLKTANEKLRMPASSIAQPDDGITSIMNVRRVQRHIVKDATAVFVVCHFTAKGKISGEPAWGTQMAIDANIPVFAFDQLVNAWKIYDNGKFRTVDEPGLPSSSTPRPTTYACLGSPFLVKTGRDAIVKLIEKIVVEREEVAKVAQVANATTYCKVNEKEK